IVTGRDDFLTEKNVRGSLCFFQYLLSPEKIFLFQSAKKLLWDSDERNLSIEEAVEKYKLLIGKKKLSFFLENWIKDMEMEDEGMKKFVSMAPFHKKLEDFLNSLSRGTEGELKRWGGKGYTWDAVNLMTFHGAKGLEFRAVILIGVNEGIIPLIHQRGEENLEEERRLFYVGLTRAKEELVLVTSKEPSRFLKEIPKEYMEKKERGGDRRWIEGRQMSLFDK
ncbi:ATP-dependent helicase, partial [bacterium 1XD42-8]